MISSDDASTCDFHQANVSGVTAPAGDAPPVDLRPTG
jgi:hypothetical protein